MWERLANFFDKCCFWKKKSSQVYYPRLEPILPVAFPINGADVVLNTDGTITGDLRTFEDYMENTCLNSYPEDRIVWWLLLQYWRTHDQVAEIMRIGNESQHDDWGLPIQREAQIELKPAHVTNGFSKAATDAIIGQWNKLPSSTQAVMDHVHQVELGAEVMAAGGMLAARVPTVEAARPSAYAMPANLMQAAPTEYVEVTLQTTRGPKVYKVPKPLKRTA